MTEPPQPPAPQDPFTDPPQNTPVYGTPIYQAGQASVPPYSASPYEPLVEPTPRKRNTGLIIGIVAGVLALCLIGVCGAVAGFFILKPSSSDDPEVQASPSPVDSYSPPEVTPTTEAPPPPAPARVGDCISVNESGDFLGVGDCSKGGATYKVLTVDYSKGTCEDPESGHIFADGYLLCLERYLLETYCYKFPKTDGWVVPASKCKAKGTVHIIDILQGASNGDKCTRDYKWNRWYRFTHPVTVYCVIEY